MIVTSSASSIQTKNKVPRIVFVGQPNTGKSTFFNTVTKSNAGVANWPGLTVDFMQANLDYNGKTYEFVDLPGIYDLEGFTEDELVVQKFLENYNFDLIVCVINSSQIDRQILMPLQIQKLGLPCVLMLNMADEVKRFGVKINTKELSETLNMPVFTISAKYGSGCVLAIQGIWDKLQTIDDSYKCSDIASFFRANKVTDNDMDEVTRIGVEMPSEDVTTFSNRLDSILLNRVVGLPIFFYIYAFGFSGDLVRGDAFARSSGKLH
jgi:ferrous iron transport protein B